MYIDNALLDILIKTLVIEYNGTYNSDPKNPLLGRAAYWRVYLEGYGFVCKITTPVKSIKPKQATLDKLLRAELKKRIEAIHERATTNHYGEIGIEYRDPYNVRRLVESLERKYIQIYFKNSNQNKEA